MAVSNSSTPRRRWFWRLSLLAALLTVVATGILLMQLNAGSLHHFDTSVAHAAPLMSGIRLSLLALLYLILPGLLRVLLHRELVHPGLARQLLGARHRLLLLLITLELLVGLDALNHLLALLRWLLT